ncbi:phage/plasmid replication protein [Halalkalibaculum sp. DA3122]|uniref:phage/plasmid replication domain-containing protein n=1 Tax=Halalkalibaculum sp. DA3122 TaxID=3373607 RepID=UPI0037551922
MMFDSLKLYLKQERASNTDLLAQTPVHLEKIKEHRQTGRIHYSGKLKNLSIYVSERGVSIRGSLAKYYLDDNLQTLTRQDTEQAINKLTDDLHIPVKKADVFRIDFAYNFVMKYEPTIYYNYLGGSQYFSRFRQPKSLYYKNGKRTKLFYDKRSEAKNKAVELLQKNGQ